MKRLAAALLFLGLLPTLAVAQVNLNAVPPNSVIGRLGIPSQGGPAQAIQFSVLVQALANSQPTCAANTVMAGPATGAAIQPSCRVLVPADIPSVAIPPATLTGFATHSAAAAATIASTVTSVSLAGYVSANDGGGGTYSRLASPPGTVKAWHFQSADGAWWQLVASPVLPRQVGAALDGSTDDTAAMQAWLDYGAAFGVISAGQSGTAVIPTAALNLSANSVLDGRGLLTTKRTTNVVGSLLDCNAHSNVTVRNLALNTTAGFSSTSSNTIGNTTQTYTVTSGLGLVVGNFVQITANTNNAAHVNYEIAVIVSYSGTTLVVTASTSVGSGTFAAWLIDYYPQNGDLAASNIGMRFTGCNQVLAEGNSVTGRFYNAYDSRNGSDVTFNRNFAQGWVNRGIHAASYLSGNSAINNQITYNHLIGGSFAQYGVNTSQSDFGVAAGFTIAGNRIEGTTFQGIIVAGGMTASTVTSNNVQMAFSTTGVGILVEALTGTDGLTVPQHITVGQNNISGGLQGVLVTQSFYGTLVGNTVSAAGGACYSFLGPTTGSTAYWTVSGNSGQACAGSGIGISGSVSGGVTGMSVVGNTLIGNTGFGISADNTASNGNYSGNVSLSNTAGAYSIATGVGNISTGGNL